MAPTHLDSAPAALPLSSRGYNPDTSSTAHMPIAAGTRLGVYEFIAPIGAGGMGEVYRARDTRLGRDVALKILPDAFAHDPERLARFRREAASAHWHSSSLMVSRWRSVSRKAPFRSPRPWGSRASCQMRSTLRTPRASSTAI